MEQTACVLGAAMALIHWDASFEFKIASIDADHQHLVELTNSLHEAICVGTAADLVSHVLDELAKYAIEHFAREERLFRQYNYVDHQHVKGHEQFAVQIQDFRQRFARHERSIDVHLTYFLRDWLTEHIKGTDAQYVPHLKAKGAI